MKTTSHIAILSVVLGLSGIALVLWAGADSRATAQVAPSNAKVSITVTPPPVIGLYSVGTVPAVDTSIEWTNIKDYTYAQRLQLLSGLSSVQARVDAQIAELRAKRATMLPPTRTVDWDFAMQEMLNARAYLRSMSWDLAKATPQTWDQIRERVGQAWVRTQDAYGRVKASTTT